MESVVSSNSLQEPFSHDAKLFIECDKCSVHRYLLFKLFFTLKFLRFLLLLSSQNFAAGMGPEYDNPKVKPSSSANAIYSLAIRYIAGMSGRHLITKCVYNILSADCFLCNHEAIHFLPRPSPGMRPVTGEEARDNEEESEYMFPCSRPVLPPITALPAGETPAIPRHPQPLPALQTQTQAPTHNSRYLDSLGAA